MESFRLYTSSFLEQKRHQGDLDADQFISYIFEDVNKKSEFFGWLNAIGNNADLKHIPAQFANYPLFVNSMLLPDWVNPKLMGQGASFFARYAKRIMNLLGVLSLPYCYAAANGAMVLFLSDRMKTDVEKRLSETGEFIWDVMSPVAFEREGKAFVSILKVRLMHAAVRFYTLKSGQWNSEWGMPVNQEDMAGTNLSFSLLIIRGLRKLGAIISYQEQMAFMHLWNVIGYMLGVEVSLLPQNGKAAYILEESIRLRQFKQSEQGIALTQSLTNYFFTVNNKGQFSNGEVVQLMRYLLGKSIADIIALPSPELSLNKIKLLKTANLLDFITTMPESVFIAYKNGYYQFRKEKIISRHGNFVN